MAADLEAVAERLAGIGEELADLALGRLQRAADEARGEGEADPGLAAEERRITRARRAVEKAASLLVGPGVRAEP